MRVYLIVYMLFGFCHSLIAQAVHFSEPKKLGENVNSEAEEMSPMLSFDGKTLYFSRAFDDDNVGGKYAGTDIWMSQKSESGEWTEATNNLGNLNNKDNNAVIGIKDQGIVLYLLNSYNRKSGISFTKLVNNKWIKPEFIEIPGLTKEGFVGFYVSPDYEVILISFVGPDTHGKEDLYVSLKKDGEWTKPVNLGATVNTSGYEISPFLSHDKKRIYFASNGHQGYGDADIFMSERLYNSWTVWTIPQNLGSSINSEKFDAYFSITEDSTVFFTSNRAGGYADIYESKIVSKDNEGYTDMKNLLKETQGLLNQLKADNEVHSIDFGENEAQLKNEDQAKIEEFIATYGEQQKFILTFDAKQVIRNNSLKLLNNKRQSAVMNFLISKGYDINNVVIEKDGSEIQSQTNKNKNTLYIIHLK
ncbi:PD40 domain-containing protein [Fulvivirga sediminis]|uniref:PD40 domain-containing protein n=1 Tax=Fulvivirga sediminis TaxID=2803949 RepID=A0A937K0A8_9BACT|nr:PD40 domain-containing protein [Fulvivirga sediminis]MBL3658178.1 PD40 domain-containing protein [Fulvivirga sediminis]